ncbi:MAG: phosphoribosylamine--glycine ligase [Candidatus Dormibacteria bacterium]
MRVLVVGSGGREHALAWACARHHSNPEILCAPGNAGTAELGTNVAVSVTDGRAIARLAREREVDLVIVGPDAALAAGVADACDEAGVPVFGPSAEASRIEWSKAHAKRLMDGAGVPTARWRSGDGTSRGELVDFVLQLDGRCVVKADGLAAGKGVMVCGSREEALAAVSACLTERRFGDAGDVVVVEERLTGSEVSVFAICDGRRYQLLAPARDYKRAEDADRGPNTGGMGAYAPVEDGCPPLEEVAERVIEPTLAALAEAGTPFVGCLYAGLMIGPDGLRVLEFNARFGDPETQAVVPLAGAGFLDLLLAAARGELEGRSAPPPAGAAVTVVAAAPGYPAAPRVGDPILGLGDLDADVLCFHAGTARDERGRLVTAGGRVLGIVGQGRDVGEARRRAYENLGRVHFAGMWSRSDIATLPAGVT